MVATNVPDARCHTNHGLVMATVIKNLSTTACSATGITVIAARALAGPMAMSYKLSIVVNLSTYCSLCRL